MSAHLTLITKLIKDAQIVIRVVGNAFLAIGITALLLLSLTACGPIINSGDSQNPATQEELQVTGYPNDVVVTSNPAQSTPSTPGSQQVTPEVAELSLPTNTPEPSPTARPHYDINDPATWPQEMQDYFNRAPEEWNSPTRQYVSNEVFDQFIQQSRRGFLTDMGIDGVDSMNEQEVFTEYVRWGMENRQVITLSPLEKINISNGPYAVYHNNLNIGEGGIGFDFNFSSAPTAPEQLEHLQGYSQVQHMVLGEMIDFNRPGNVSMIGTLIGIARPTGTRAEQAADCLMYYEQGGQGYWAIVAVSLTPETHIRGEKFVTIYDGGLYSSTYTTNNIGYSFLQGIDGKPITQQDLLDFLGQTLFLRMHGFAVIDSEERGPVNVTIELTAAGLEKAGSVIPQPIPSTLPWD